MPKSKKRKNAKKYKAKSTAPVSDAHGQSASPSSRTESIVELLYADDAKVLKQLIAYFPVISGSCLAAGLKMQNGLIFFLLMGTVFYLHYLELLLRGKLAPFRTQKIIFGLHGLAAVMIIGFYLATRSLEASVGLVAYTILGICSIGVSRQSVRGLAFYSVALLFQMMLLAVLGAFSQSLTIFLPIALLGFIPGSYLVSAELALHAELFEAAGWRRSEDIEKKSSVVQRPSGLTRLFTLLLVMGPLVPITLSPLNKLPVAFLLCALPIYFLPSLGTAFLERLQSNRMIALRCIHLAFLASIVALISGLLSQF